MEIFFLWVIFSLVVGFIGSGRKIGFWGALICSILLSPLIGLIIALASKNLETQHYERELVRSQQKQEQSLENLTHSKTSITDELLKLKALRKQNEISETEFQQLRRRLIDE